MKNDNNNVRYHLAIADVNEKRFHSALCKYVDGSLFDILCGGNGVARIA